MSSCKQKDVCKDVIDIFYSVRAPTDRSYISTQMTQVDSLNRPPQGPASILNLTSYTLS